jgi:polar amino acid transport system permease protein
VALSTDLKVSANDPTSNALNSNGVGFVQRKIVPLRHPWTWIGALAALGVLAWWISVMVGAEAFGWTTVGEYLFNAQVRGGIVNTLIMTAVCMVIGCAVGTVLAVMRLSGNAVLISVSAAYIWFFRGVPTLVQLLFWFNLGSIFPALSVDVFGWTLFSLDTNEVMTPMVTCALGLGLSFAAFYSEIVRSGILSVDEGQIEAATAYGLNRFQSFRYIVFPQAMRVIIPPTGNELISMLKWTSAGVLVAYGELLYEVTRIYSRNYEVIPLLVVASIWYLAMVTILSIGQLYVERYYARGASRNQSRSLLQIIRGAIVGRKRA